MDQVAAPHSRARNITARNLLRYVFIVMGLGLLVSATVAWNDKGRRATLERVAMPTGLGVTDYFPLPQPLEFQTELAKFGGLPVYAASLNLRQIPETELEVLTTGQPGDPPVFRRFLGGKEGQREREYFLKVGAGQYLRVHQGPDIEAFAAGRVGAVEQRL